MKVPGFRCLFLSFVLRLCSQRSLKWLSEWLEYRVNVDQLCIALFGRR